MDCGRKFALLHFLELGGCVAEDRFEVVDQMCLVEVAEIERELREVKALAGAEAFDSFMKTVAADDPLGADAYVFAEEALQGALAYGRASSKVIYCEHIALLERLPNEFFREHGFVVGFGNARLKEAVGCGQKFVIWRLRD